MPSALDAIPASHAGAFCQPCDARSAYTAWRKAALIMFIIGTYTPPQLPLLSAAFGRIHRECAAAMLVCWGMS